MLFFLLYDYFCSVWLLFHLNWSISSMGIGVFLISFYSILGMCNRDYAPKEDSPGARKIIQQAGCLSWMQLTQVSISGIPYSPSSTARKIPECKVKSQLWVSLGVTLTSPPHPQKYIFLLSALRSLGLNLLGGDLFVFCWGPWKDYLLLTTIEKDFNKTMACTWDWNSLCENQLSLEYPGYY